jgi:hypothetical protein
MMLLVHAGEPFAALFESSVIMMQQKGIDESFLHEMVYVFLAPPHKVSKLVLVQLLQGQI